LSTPDPLYRNPLFRAAILLGPLYWLSLCLYAPPVVQWDKPLLHPVWFVQLVLIYPVLEEIVFRGLLQELVRVYVSRAVFGPLSMANLLTSLLFAAAHLINNPAPAALLVFFPSLVFGYFRDRTGALTASVFLHCFYNAGFAWLFMVPA